MTSTGKHTPGDTLTAAELLAVEEHDEQRARLHDAADDLLEAAKGALWFIEGLTKSHHAKPELDWLRAIAKAEGL